MSRLRAYWLSTPEVFGADVAETAFTVLAGDQRHARKSG